MTEVDQVKEAVNKHGEVCMRPYAAIAIMLFIAVGCSSDKKPARTALWTAANAVDVALSPDADKFAPIEVTELQNKLASLNSAYEHCDYAAVIDQAAAVSASANHLADMVLIDANRSQTACAVGSVRHAIAEPAGRGPCQTARTQSIWAHGYACQFKCRSRGAWSGRR